MLTKRRKFLAGLGAAGLAACSKPAEAPQTAAAEPSSSKTFKWKMVTTWPPNFPGLGTGAVNLARMIESASGGRIRIQVYAGGELIPSIARASTKGLSRPSLTGSQVEAPSLDLKIPPPSVPA